MSRKLASIQRIIGKGLIEGATSIERIDVLGWHCVAKINEFFINDMCVYIETDSILPEKPEFEFLRDRKFRVKIARMLKQVSQGICFPLSILPPDTVIEEGLDVSDIIGVKKFELPEFDTGLGAYGLGHGQQKGNFPSFCIKSDETRLQAIPKVLDYLRNERCYISLKADGSSILFYLKDGQFGVCSRSMEKKDVEGCHFWHVAHKYNIEEKMRTYSQSHNGVNFWIQGELCGMGVQKNRMGLKDYNVFLFNVYDIDNNKYLDYEDFVACVKEMGLETVPILDDNFVITEDVTVDSMVELAVRKSIINPSEWQEGIVVRPVKEMNHPKYGRTSFKVINYKYLLKHEE